MGKEQAMQEYIEKVEKLDPRFQKESPSAKGASGSFGVTVSTFAIVEEALCDDSKTLLDWVSCRLSRSAG